MKQMNILVQLILIITLLLATLQVQAGPHTKKVLMVVSGNGFNIEEESGNDPDKKRNASKKRPGYEFDEFSKAYAVFKSNGILVDIASPKGGKVTADKYDPNKLHNAQALADDAIMAKLNNTLSTATIDAKTYDAVFVVGGKGAMFDLPNDVALQNIIADIYQQQGSVAAVCHGPAALVNVKLKDGSYLVANKVVNSFTNQEEQLFGQQWINDFDFMLEDKLIERGAKFQSSQIMLSHVAVDERLITGQNPASTMGVATALVESVGVTSVSVATDSEDKTLALVAKYLAGDKSALNLLNTNQAQYNIPLVGMYGFYFLKGAEARSDFEQSLALMLLAQKVINNPSLDMKIAKTQVKLGQANDAKATLNALITAKPDYKPARDMLITL